MWRSRQDGSIVDFQWQRTAPHVCRCTLERALPPGWLRAGRCDPFGGVAGIQSDKVEAPRCRNLNGSFIRFAWPVRRGEDRERRLWVGYCQSTPRGEQPVLGGLSTVTRRRPALPGPTISIRDGTARMPRSARRSCWHRATPDVSNEQLDGWRQRKTLGLLGPLCQSLVERCESGSARTARDVQRVSEIEVLVERIERYQDRVANGSAATSGQSPPGDAGRRAPTPSPCPPSRSNRPSPPPGRRAASAHPTLRALRSWRPRPKMSRRRNAAGNTIWPFDETTSIDTMVAVGQGRAHGQKAAQVRVRKAIVGVLERPGVHARLCKRASWRHSEFSQHRPEGKDGADSRRAPGAGGQRGGAQS